MKAEELRKSILQMAIQGKLVPQDPNDEPASVLLDRIRAEKQKLIKEGKIKKDKTDSIIFKGDDNCHYEKIGNEIRNIEDEIDFDLPDGWEWARIKTFCITVFSGKSPIYSREKTDHKVIGQQANQWDGVNFRFVKYCTDDFVHDMSETYYLQNGDVLLNTLGNGTLGRSGIILDLDINEKILTDGHLFVFRNLDVQLSRYLLLLLRTKYDEIVKSANGSTNQTFLSLSKTLQWLIPVPPKKELEKIISELDKYKPLLAEYDKLEQAKTKLDSEIYDNLKKSILQYAIQGKLVPQDPNNEPASVLLERIRAEKKAKLGKKYVESYIYKGDDNCYYEKVGKNEPVKLEDLPFDIPDSWSWARLKDIVYNNGQKTPTSDFSYIDIGSIDNIHQKLSSVENIVSADKAPSRARKIIKYGDILYSTVRPYLHNMCIIDKRFSKEAIASTGFAVLSCEEGMINKYLFYYMLSPIFDQYANSTENSKGVAYPAINDDRLYKALVPIPPQSEQKRIWKNIEVIFQSIEKGEI